MTSFTCKEKKEALMNHSVCSTVRQRPCKVGMRDKMFWHQRHKHTCSICLHNVGCPHERQDCNVATDCSEFSNVFGYGVYTENLPLQLAIINGTLKMMKDGVILSDEDADYLISKDGLTKKQFANWFISNYKLGAEFRQFHMHLWKWIPEWEYKQMKGKK